MDSDGAVGSSAPRSPPSLSSVMPLLVSLAGYPNTRFSALGFAFALIRCYVAASTSKSTIGGHDAQEGGDSDDDGDESDESGAGRSLVVVLRPASLNHAVDQLSSVITGMTLGLGVSPVQIRTVVHRPSRRTTIGASPPCHSHTMHHHCANCTFVVHMRRSAT